MTHSVLSMCWQDGPAFVGNCREQVVRAYVRVSECACVCVCALISACVVEGRSVYEGVCVIA